MLYFATSPFLNQIQFPLLEILPLCSLEKIKNVMFRGKGYSEKY